MATAVPIKVFRRFADASLDDGTGDASFSDEVFGFTGTYDNGTISGAQPFRFLLSQAHNAEDPAIKTLREMEKKQWDTNYVPAPGTPAWPALSLSTAIDGIFAGM